MQLQSRCECVCYENVNPKLAAFSISFIVLHLLNIKTSKSNYFLLSIVLIRCMVQSEAEMSKRRSEAQIEHKECGVVSASLFVSSNLRIVC